LPRQLSILFPFILFQLNNVGKVLVWRKEAIGDRGFQVISVNYLSEVATEAVVRLSVVMVERRSGDSET
jgi:hypothetical protein